MGIVENLAANRDYAAERAQVVADRHRSAAAALRERGTGPFVESLAANRDYAAERAQVVADRHRSAAAALRRAEAGRIWRCVDCDTNNGLGQAECLACCRPRPVSRVRENLGVR